VVSVSSTHSGRDVDDVVMLVARGSSLRIERDFEDRSTDSEKVLPPYRIF
jgi:hypothetical protein